MNAAGGDGSKFCNAASLPPPYLLSGAGLKAVTSAQARSFAPHFQLATLKATTTDREGFWLRFLLGVIAAIAGAYAFYHFDLVPTKDKASAEADVRPVWNEGDFFGELYGRD